MKKIFILILLALGMNAKAQTPNWLWAKNIINTPNVSVRGITTDANKNIIIFGTYACSSITFGLDTVINNGYLNIFIVKYDSMCNLLWDKITNSVNDIEGTNITTDRNNNIIITGDFSDTITAFGSDTLISKGTSNMFVAKYDPAGNVLWAKSAGGTNFDAGGHITTDAFNNIIVSGTFMSYDIIFGNDTLFLSCDTVSNSDVFIAKYDPSGNVIWAKSAKGKYWDTDYGITTDVNNNILITGDFNSPNLIFGNDTLFNNNPGNPSRNIFVVKYNLSGNVIWAKSAGSNDDDMSDPITTDADKNVIITGDFLSPTTTFGTHTLTNISVDTADFFIVKYDSTGNVLWAKSAGGNKSDYGSGVVTDDDKNIIVIGNFQSPFITFGTDTLTNNNYSNFFLVKYDALGNKLWAYSANENSRVSGYEITKDASNNIIIDGGYYNSLINFGKDTLINTHDTTYSFLAKFNNNNGTGINTLNPKMNSMIIYPNPANDIITIRSKHSISNIEIYNTLGEIVSVINSKETTNNINISSFANGLYFIKVITEKGITVKKFIIEKKQ